MINKIKSILLSEEAPLWSIAFAPFYLVGLIFYFIIFATEEIDIVGYLELTSPVLLALTFTFIREWQLDRKKTGPRKKKI